MIDIVNGILKRNEEFLVVRRSQQRRSYPNTWSFPGGHVEQDETLERALERELQEELSIVPTEYLLLDVIDDPNAPNEDSIRYHMFLVTDWDPDEPVIANDEHAEMAWLRAGHALALRDLALLEYRDIFQRLRD